MKIIDKETISDTYVYITLFKEALNAGVYILPKISNCSRERQKNQ